MSLATFLQSIRGRVLEGIGASGDSPEQLYAPKTLRDSKDKSAVEFSVRIMGVVSAEGHEAWITVWCRDRDQTDRIETVLGSLDEWEETGDKQSGERLFRKRGSPVVFGFGDDGTATMIHTETGRAHPFGSAKYRELITDLWNDMTFLLTRPVAQAPSAKPPEAPSAAADAWGAASSRTDAALGGLAVERGYLTQQQIDEALEIQHKLHEDMGVDQPLVQVLVGKHWLTADQAQELRAAAAVQTGEARLVAGYEAISKLGQGGMGAVYKARRVGTEEFVALKVLPPSLADKAMIARFQRESEIVRKLEHENIVDCIEFGFDKRRRCYFCALELVDGENLAQHINRAGRLSEHEALSIVRQISGALQHAFFSGLVHRDVKPENIMVTPNGTAKLLDLGLARPASQEATRLTESGIFIGSPYYASPEQALGQKEVDIRADIYSLGATLYHMVTGKPPFEATTPLAILQKHLTEKLPWPARVNPDLSDGLCQIIARMMEKSPDDRYQTPNDLNRDLDLLMDGEEPEAADMMLKNSSVKVPAVRPRRRERPASGDRIPRKRARDAAGPSEREAAPSQDRRRGPAAAGEGRSPVSSGLKIAMAGVVVVLMGAMGLLLLLGGPPRRRQDAGVPGGEITDGGAGASGPSAAGEETPSPADGPARPVAPGSAEITPASKRLREIKAMLDPSFKNYAEGRRMLQKFLAEFPDAREATEARSILIRMDAAIAEKAEVALQRAEAKASALASAGRFDEARRAVESERRSFDATDALKKRGELRIALAVARIEASRRAFARAAMVRAREALRAGRLAEARSALATRAQWPDEARRSAKAVLGDVARAEAEAAKERGRQEAWRRFLVGLHRVGKRDVRAASEVVAREGAALREAGLGQKLARFEKLVREAELVDELIVMGLGMSKKMLRVRWKGRIVAGRPTGIEGRVLGLEPVVGAAMRIPLDEIHPEELLRLSGVARPERGNRLRIAAYLALRGEFEAARRRLADVAGKKAAALREDIDELARALVPPKITSAAPAEAREGVFYSHTFTASGGKPVAFSLDDPAKLPGGLTWNAAAATISGSPTAGGTSPDVTVTATNGMAPDATQVFKITVTDAPPPPEGRILREWWLPHVGGAPAVLSRKNPRDPTGSEYVTSFDGPRDWKDNYNSRIRGYVHPPADGGYVFRLCSDDQSQLWLSTDDDPANMAKIAEIDGYKGYTVWSVVSGTIPLLAGRRYYVEAVHKEGGVNDHIRVGWDRPDGVSDRPIPGRFLSPWREGGAAAPRATASASSAAGLVGHWKFDEGQGTTARDSSGRANDGTIVGGASWTTGKVGGALEFDGTDDYVEIAHTAALAEAVTKDCTIVAWVKLDVDVAGQVDDLRSIFGYGYEHGNCVALVVNRNHANWIANRIGAVHSNARISSSVTVVADTWYHVALVHRGTDLTLHVNGTADGAGTTGLLTVPGSPLRIGTQSKETTRRFFGGLIDDVRIYDRALSVEEIRALATP